MNQQWIVSNPHREPPSNPLPSHPVFETWERFIAEIIPSDDDYEYFVEEAYRLHSAVTSFGAGNIWLSEFRGEKAGQARNLITGQWSSVSDLKEAGASHYGAIPGTRHAGWFSNPMDDYCTFETFKNNAGRITGVGGFADRPDETSSMDDVLSAIKEEGGQQALLKRRHAKLSLIKVDLAEWKPRSSITSCVGPDDGWALINDEGVRDAYLVQEVIPMRFEYRFFVINGRLVTGAGCVEEFTPLDNGGEAFDSRMREYRSGECPSPIEARADVLSQFIPFAKQVVAELAAERPEFDRYVLDVALGKNDEPVIVEFNSESNAGFYACVPQLITDALVSNSAR